MVLRRLSRSLEGCCGGLHFSDVLTLDLNKMVWSTLVTTGQKPGTRDSHSAVLVGHKMIVIGGTNGSKKVNDLHILDLRTREWTRPICEGNPPSARESHTATVLGDSKLVIFGGSGEGEGNYLNDVHILNLNTMAWSSPEVKGNLPAPRDSHTAVTVENKLIVYGGDCGDRYHGKVDVLDMDTLTWSRLPVQGSFPGVRAGHAAVNIGSKVYIIGGVGDKHYYNDVWVLDVSACSWSQIGICGQSPQGRFSHSAVVADSDIAIYGGCGEDERPLNELLILQLGGDHPNGRYNISLCKMFGSHWNQEKRRFLRGVEHSHKNVVLGNREPSQGGCDVNGEVKSTSLRNLNNLKRRKTSDFKSWNLESEQEEHSLSVSQQSSPSQSDQEQIPGHKLSSVASETMCVSPPIGSFKKQSLSHNQSNSALEQRNHIRRNGRDFHFTPGDFRRQPKADQFIHVVHNGKPDTHIPRSDHKAPERQVIPSLIGAKVHGTVDGAFDSGYLMTANVNGQILRGVLFAPGPGIVPRAFVPQTTCVATPVVVAQPCPGPAQASAPYARPQPQAISPGLESGHHIQPSESMAVCRPTPKRAKLNSDDLQGVVLTLGSCHSKS
ncbi:acyl-CoA-binding domain-containing protein 4-like isoform X2 [Aristolochia californica]|uniref:acyl-CoA-binding domain-containing protein 4-like isoform X2 n=1 Tax=Aristolochia californica TaxID=171875 RepID=UPI0035DBB316